MSRDTTTRTLRLFDDSDPPSVLEASRMLNVSPQRIYQILDDHDVPPPTKRDTREGTHAA